MNIWRNPKLKLKEEQNVTAVVVFPICSNSHDESMKMFSPSAVMHVDDGVHADSWAYQRYIAGILVSWWRAR